MKSTCQSLAYKNMFKFIIKVKNKNKFDYFQVQVKNRKTKDSSRSKSQLTNSILKHNDTDMVKFLQKILYFLLVLKVCDEGNWSGCSAHLEFTVVNSMSSPESFTEIFTDSPTELTLTVKANRYR